MRKPKTAPLTRGSAKWRVAGIKANLETAMKTFSEVFTEEEVQQLVGVQEHLDYVLKRWAD